MLNLPKDFKEFIELLNAHEVRYLIVGGYAVAFHGFPRMTGDIDFFVEATYENAKRLERVLDEFGFGSLGLDDNDFYAADTIIQLGYTPQRIDIMTAVGGLNFDEAWRNRVEAEGDGVIMVYVGKENLLESKAASGRSKDLIDLDALTDQR